MEKVNLLLTDPGMRQAVEVSLDSNHLKLFRHGVTSVPVDKKLRYIGLAHAAKKSLQDLDGDDFIRHYYEGDSRHTDLLMGPVQPLDEDELRTLIINTSRSRIKCSCGGTGYHRSATPYQPPCWSDGSFEESLEECQILALYDSRSVCFVTQEGHCLLVHRQQITQRIF